MSFETCSEYRNLPEVKEVADELKIKSPLHPD